MKSKYTRRMISAALNGELENVEYGTLPVFNLHYPLSCPGVPAEMLNPRQTWKDEELYELTLEKLANFFIKNFDKYEDYASEDIMAGSPSLSPDNMMAL